MRLNTWQKYLIRQAAGTDRGNLLIALAERLNVEQLRRLWAMVQNGEVRL